VERAGEEELRERGGVEEVPRRMMQHTSAPAHVQSRQWSRLLLGIASTTELATMKAPTTPGPQIMSPTPHCSYPPPPLACVRIAAPPPSLLLAFTKAMPATTINPFGHGLFFLSLLLGR
jgi:hypothetical protein